MIIVVGGSRGLGAAIVERLRAQGESVAVLSRTGDAADDLHFSADVTDAQRLKAVAREIKALGRPVTALLNVAGVASMNMALTTPAHVTEKIIGINLMGTIFSCQAFAPLMVRRKWGRIINFSSVAVPFALAGETVYAASKAGVEAFSRTLARELASVNITVNTVAPGPIRTDLLRGVSDSMIKAIVDQQLAPFEASADDVCDVVELLLDKRSDALTGEVFYIKGA